MSLYFFHFIILRVCECTAGTYLSVFARPFLSELRNLGSKPCLSIPNQKKDLVSLTKTLAPPLAANQPFNHMQPSNKMLDQTFPANKWTTPWHGAFLSPFKRCSLQHLDVQGQHSQIPHGEANKLPEPNKWQAMSVEFKFCTNSELEYIENNLA